MLRSVYYTVRWVVIKIRQMSSSAYNNQRLSSPSLGQNGPATRLAVTSHSSICTAADTAAPGTGRNSDFRTILAHDPDELARNLTNWEQSYDQMSCGIFEGSLSERRLLQVQIFRETISQSVRQSCKAWPGSIWFGLPQHSLSTRINGRATDPGDVLLQHGGAEFELVTPSTYTIYGIVIPRTLLADVATRTGSMIDWKELEHAEVLKVDVAARVRFVQLLAGWLESAPDYLATHADSAWLHQRQNSLVAILVDMISHGQVDPMVARSFQRRHRVIEAVRSYVLEHRDQSISVPDLCEHAHVSRRTLQYCFEDILGVSPVSYLRILRLNGVRRQLLERERGARARFIGDVAAQWGFNNFSQFSSDYRRLFGECASASLKALAGAGG